MFNTRHLPSRSKNRHLFTCRQWPLSPSLRTSPTTTQFRSAVTPKTTARSSSWQSTSCRSPTYSSFSYSTLCFYDAFFSQNAIHIGPIRFIWCTRQIWLWRVFAWSFGYHTVNFGGVFKKRNTSFELKHDGLRLTALFVRRIKRLHAPEHWFCTFYQKGHRNTYPAPGVFRIQIGSSLELETSSRGGMFKSR